MINIKYGQRLDITWNYGDRELATYDGVIVTGFRDDALLGNFVMTNGQRANGAFPWARCTFKEASKEPQQIESYREHQDSLLLTDTLKWLNAMPQQLRERFLAKR